MITYGCVCVCRAVHIAAGRYIGATSEARWEADLKMPQ